VSCGVDFTPEQLAELRRLLGLPPAAPELVVQAGIMLQFGMAGDLAADVDQMLAAEIDYLRSAARLGWAHWTLEVDEPDRPG
jgi:hypothetical protein